MNFYTWKQRLGPFEDPTVYTCIFLSHELLRAAHFPPDNHILGDPEVKFDPISALSRNRSCGID